MDKYELSLTECSLAAKEIAEHIAKRSFVLKDGFLNIYGVPRGGIPVAYMVKEALDEMKQVTIKSQVVFSIDYANVIVDDIIDTGATKHRYTNQGLPFYALIDKPKTGQWYIFPWERNENEGTGAEDSVTRFLQFIGEDLKRPGIAETPHRVVKSWEEIYKGYKMVPKELFKVFEEPCDQMVILRNIEFYSMCEHHCLPFFGKVHIAYLPHGGKVVGVSKLARLVDCFSRRLQIQERMTQQIVDAIQENLKPSGAACFVEAQHLCMMARGVEKQNSVMVTSALTGVFKEKDLARVEFLLLNGRGGLNG
jgi:GTP cyclohydrolase I